MQLCQGWVARIYHIAKFWAAAGGYEDSNSCARHGMWMTSIPHDGLGAPRDD